MFCRPQSRGFLVSRHIVCASIDDLARAPKPQSYPLRAQGGCTNWGTRDGRSRISVNSVETSTQQFTVEKPCCDVSRVAHPSLSSPLKRVYRRQGQCHCTVQTLRVARTLPSHVTPRKMENSLPVGYFAARHLRYHRGSMSAPHAPR